MDHDLFFAGEGDVDAARELVHILGSGLAELFVYPGDQHLFANNSLPSYDADASKLALEPTIESADRKCKES